MVQPVIHGTTVHDDFGFEVNDALKAHYETSIAEIDQLLVDAALVSDKEAVIALASALVQIKEEFSAALSKLEVDEVAFMSSRSLRRTTVIRTVLRDRALYLDSACTSHLFHSSMLPGTFNRRPSLQRGHSEEPD